MRSPSSKYLYGFTSTFGTNVNATQADYDAVEAEMRAEQRALEHDRRPQPATAGRRTDTRA